MYTLSHVRTRDRQEALRSTNGTFVNRCPKFLGPICGSTVPLAAVRHAVSRKRVGGMCVMGVSFMGVSAVSVVSMVAVHRGGPLRAKSVNRCRKTEGPCGATYTCGERADPRGLAHLESGRAHPPIRCPFCTGPRNPGHRKRGSARSSSFASDPAPQAPRNALTDRTRASLALLVHPVRPGAVTTGRPPRIPGTTCAHDRTEQFS